MRVLVSLEAKSKNPKSDLALTGTDCFELTILEGIEIPKPSWKGELKIAVVIHQMITPKCKVKYSTLDGSGLTAALSTAL